MTTLVLVRHGHTDAVGTYLAGRLPGVCLSPVGRVEAQRVAARVAALRPTAIHCSPRARAAETAAAISDATGVPAQTVAELDEVEFGSWTGRTFTDLAGEPAWRAFNSRRAITIVPGGESMIQVQARVVGWMAGLVARHPDGIVVAVSHADVIRAALAACAGLHVDLAQRLDVHTASISEVGLDGDDVRVRRVNDVGHLA